MATTKGTKGNFEKEVMQSKEPVLVDFYATWCGPCQMLSPVLEEIANENHGFKVVKINVDEERELTSTFGVQSIPTLFVIENGKVVNKTMGYKDKNELLNLMKHK